MTAPSVLLFAAGFGTRMGALTADRPKPLIEVSGRPLIDHALDLARAIDPPRIVANLHYRPQQLADHLAARMGLRAEHRAERVAGAGLLAPDLLAGRHRCASLRGRRAAGAHPGRRSHVALQLQTSMSEHVSDISIGLE